LIIFDLDDTLIDTSGTITPFKLRLCVERFLALGVVLPPLDEAHQELLEINRFCLKSQEAIAKFGRKYGAKEDAIVAACQEMVTPLPESFSIAKTPHAEEILRFYHAKCPLAIVTGGYPPFQLDKLKKAGIEVSLFSMIGVPEDSVKKPYYAALQKRFELPSQEIWVCGDRIEMDLRPAFELGFQTVHMQWGRGKNVPQEPWITHSIRNLNELKEKIR
jgi:FMN phosphatase YigB (HAD superfamily)